MRKLIALIIVAVVVGCGKEIVLTEICDSGNNKSDKIAEFVLTCVKNGNSMSDEMVERVVRQCEETAIRVYSTNDYAPTGCKPAFYYRIRERNLRVSPVIPCTKAKTAAEKEICGHTYLEE
jgi:hypothetical protein